MLSSKNSMNCLLKLKYVKEHLCSSYELGKAKHGTFKTKKVPSSIEWLHLLHMDLCGSIRVESINGKKYILVVVGAYSRVSDGQNLNTMKEKGDACIIMGYATQSRGFKVYNKRTRLIFETIHINFDELKSIASEDNTLGPAPQRDYQVVSRSFAAFDNSQINDTTPSTPTTFVASFTLIELDAQSDEDEFINPFGTPVAEAAESSSRNVDTSNMHTFYQRYLLEFHWTKDHPLEQVLGNPTKQVQTRHHLDTDLEMCMFALTSSIADEKNIKESMDDHASIEAMPDEIH
ncbi:hypothetical protein Tco_1024280 [Tanacetum coccineum]